MLPFPSPAALARRLAIRENRLYDLLNRFDNYVEELVITNPLKPDKVRKVISTRPPLRDVQRKFYRWVLLPNLARSQHSHGGVPGRSIRTNALAHVGQNFVYTTDVSDFFPSIHYERVRAMFVRLGCAESVAALCTRLCTYNARLEQGLVTSPILADQMMTSVDQQIGKACQELDLIYTRYVDDISISGPFNFERSGIPGLVRRILRCNGFKAKEEKEQFGSFSDGTTVTKLRILGNRLDVQGSYITELERQLRDHAHLGDGKWRFTGPYYTQDQLWGRVEYVCWVNPKRRGQLYGLLNKIKWDKVREEAAKRKFVARTRGSCKLLQNESRTTGV